MHLYHYAAAAAAILILGAWSPDSHGQALVSDNFSGSSVNTNVWTFVDPLDDSQVQVNGDQLLISVPAGTSHNPWTSGNKAPRLMQTAAIQDFEVEVKFDSSVTQRYQMQGVIAERDHDTFVRADFFYDGTKLHIYTAVIDGSSASVKGDLRITNVAAPMYLRLARQGDVWTHRYSFNGESWQTAATFTQAMPVTGVGVHSGNHGTTVPAHTAVVDYFSSLTSGPTYTLSTTVSGQGSVSKSPNQSSYAAGSVVQLTAQPAAGWVFDGWSGGLTGLSNPASVTINGNTAVEARFVQDSTPEYSLSVTSSGSGTVVKNPPGGTYPAGTVVTLTAQPAAGWVFDGWSGALSGLQNPRTVTMNGNIAVQAHFIESSTPQYNVTVNMSGSGSVSLNPPGGTYSSGTVVQLTATPATGWTFSGWSGALTGSNNPASLTVTQNSALTATFIQSGGGAIVLSDIEVQSTGQTTATVTWTTNLSSSSRVDYGIGSTLSATRSGSGNVSSHSVPIAWLRCAQGYQVRVTSVSTSGAQASQQVSFTSPACPNPGVGAAPAIALWDGDYRTVGDRGQAQRWVNVRGRVSTAHTLASLSYRINGGTFRKLSVGPDSRRLASKGDFNAEIDYADLAFGLNEVEVRALDTNGRTTTVPVSITRVQMAPPPLPYTANWSQTDDVNTFAYPVDGPWDIGNDDRVSAETLDYDRLLVLGDVSWTDYEVTVTVRVNEHGPHAYTSNSGAPLVGLALRWLGHTQNSSEQPRRNWYPTGALMWYRWTGSGRYQMYGNDGSPSRSLSSPKLNFDVTYKFKAQVVTLTENTTRYRFKVWNASSSEPQPWLMEIVEDNGPMSGAIALITHHSDTDFGNVHVTFPTTP